MYNKTIPCISDGSLVIFQNHDFQSIRQLCFTEERNRLRLFKPQAEDQSRNSIVDAKSLLNVSICQHFYYYEYKCRSTSSKKNTLQARQRRKSSQLLLSQHRSRENNSFTTVWKRYPKGVVVDVFKRWRRLKNKGTSYIQVCGINSAKITSNFEKLIKF